MQQKTESESILRRHIAAVLPSRKGLEDLMAKQKIRLYLGVDATSPYLHLGHAVVLRKLREFQDAGHEVVLLMGDFTAQIGDPSGRDKMREPLTEEQIKENSATYRKQAGMILDLKKTTIRYNSSWLSKLTLKEILRLTSQMTVSRMLERDMFQRRMEQGNEIWLHEFLYPLMQGYDSVAMDVDLEVGGEDQLFNMLVGRKLQKVYNNKEKYVLTCPLLLGIDGRKMSKSYGNAINLLDDSQEMYGKVMALRDDLILHYFDLATDSSVSELHQIKKRLERGENPRDIKAELARRVVALYHGEKKAEGAENEFNRVFRKKEMPSDMPQVNIEGTLSASDLLYQAKLASSKAEARRLIQQKGVKIDGQVLQEDTPITPRSGMVIQVGKRKFVQIQ